MDNATEGFTSATEFLAFLFAGKATFTITSKATGKHYSYTVQQWRKRPEIFYVKSRSTDGTELEIGSVRSTALHRGLNLTGHSHLTEDDQRKVQTFVWFFNVLQTEGRLPRTAAVQHDGRCGVCSRQLTNPASIRLGIGPECASKLGIVCERVAA